MKTILTVDDSKVVRTMVARHLQPFGVQVVEAQNGKEGVDMALQHKPDLILLDVTMPVMDGKQCLTELRGNAITKGIPVIMLTAESGRDLVVEIAKLGVNGYIVKPFQKDTFEKEVTKVLNGAPAAAVPPPGAAAAPARLDARTVLVVDDSERVLETAKTALAQGFKVVTALSGKDALERFKESQPGVVVVDLVMPEMDGIEVLTKLKELGNPTFIALAVRGDTALHDKARKAGYASVIAKPFQAQELLEHVSKAAGAQASPEEMVQDLVSEENGCSVLTLPDSQASLTRLAPLLAKKVRDLAEDGADRLIVDIAHVAEATSEVVNCLIQLLEEARGMGIKTVICTPSEKMVTSLKEFAETAKAPYATSREAARQSLQ